MYRFALRPRWILSHLFVVLLAVSFVNLGLWQLRRLDERRSENEAIRQNLAEPVVPIGELGSLVVGEADGFAYRRATAEGTYVGDETVLVRNRASGGQPGFWVLTPLEISEEMTVVVNRGWVPFGTRTDGSDATFDTPDEAVVVEGTLREGVPGAREGGDVQVTIDHVDLEWMEARAGYELFPLYLQLESQQPPQEVPVPLEDPDLSDGPHLSYAVQWFIFSVIAVAGYPLILRRVARQDVPEHPSGGSVEGSAGMIGAAGG